MTVTVRLATPDEYGRVGELTVAAYRLLPVDHLWGGYDRDDTIERGFTALGLPLAREAFVLRTDDQVAYGRLVAAGAGIGFVARYNIAHWPGVEPLLPMLAIPPLPCWLAVHREIRGNRIVRRVFDFLADALPGALAVA